MIRALDYVFTTLALIGTAFFGSYELGGYWSFSESEETAFWLALLDSFRLRIFNALYSILAYILCYFMASIIVFLDDLGLVNPISIATPFSNFYGILTWLDDIAESNLFLSAV